MFSRVAPALARLGVTVLVLFAAVLLAGAATRKRTPAPKADSLEHVISVCFNRWDRSQDGRVDYREINAMIEDPAVRGVEAAALVVVRKHFDTFEKENDRHWFSEEQLLKLAEDAGIRREYGGVWNRIRGANRALFLPDDPNLATFHQGRVGDCYLLAVIGTYVARDRYAVRRIFTPAANSATAVAFASGRTIVVPPITDAELAMGARTGSDHGLWLSVLEKAYAVLRQEWKSKAEPDLQFVDEKVAADLVGGGGGCGKVIEQLTGHRVSHAGFGRWLKQDAEKAPQRLHELLVKLTTDKRLVAASTSHDKELKLPKGIAHAHCFGVLGYDPARRVVRVFNPWGNEVKPAGPAGLEFGYATHHGMFEVPVQEFIHAFAGISYETDKPLSK